MAEVVFRPVEPDDIDVLFANLRASDRAECEAYGDYDIREGIRASAARSLLCWAGVIDGKLAGIMGVAPVSVLNGVGSPWMLGTPVLDAHHRVLVRESARYIPRMLAAFPHLANRVHAKNTSSVRWLRRLGFTLHPPTPYGARGELFHLFEMRA